MECPANTKIASTGSLLTSVWSDVFITPGWLVMSYGPGLLYLNQLTFFGTVTKLYNNITERSTLLLVRSGRNELPQPLWSRSIPTWPSMLVRALWGTGQGEVWITGCRSFSGGDENLASRLGVRRPGCVFWGSPLVTVTVWDGEEFGVEDSIIHGESRDVMLAVVVLTAASICTLKHPCAGEKDLK